MGSLHLLGQGHCEGAAEIIAVTAAKTLAKIRPKNLPFLWKELDIVSGESVVHNHLLYHQVSHGPYPREAVEVREALMSRGTLHN